MLAQELLSALSQRADRPVFGCEGVDWTGRQCLSYVAARCEQLRAAGVSSASRVMVANLRGNRYWLDFFALWSMGAIGIPVERDATADRLRGIMEDVTPQFVCGELGQSQDVDTGLIAFIPDIDETVEQAEDTVLLDRIPCAGECMAMYTFTSGTTKRPKVVPLTHGHLLANARGSASRLPYAAGERVFAPVPFRFISAISHCLVTVLEKATYLGSEKPLFKGDLASLTREWGATAFGGSPIQVRWIVETAENTGDDFGLNWMMSSGDNLPVDLIDRAGQALPRTKIVVAYGLTEVGGRFCMLDPDMTGVRRGSVGKAIAGCELSVLDENGRPVASGEIGDVHVSGECVFDGYLKQQEENARAMSSHGFLTGDLGFLDDDGFLYLRGRSDEVFKSAGQKVSALLISQELMGLGMFSDVAVVDVAHPILERVPHVYYVPKQGMDFKKGTVVAALRGRLPSNHLPQGFTAVEAIPRTGSGKLDRRRFRELVASLAG